MPDEPDLALFARFCTEILPGMLEVCEVPAPDAVLVAEDVSLRAEAVARMDPASREVLASPFYEESFTYEPDEAPAWLKAITTLVIRNSQLEEMHANDGPVNGGITTITTYGLGPLSHLIAARRRSPLPADVADDPFVDLPEAYPRAWACLEALRTCLNCGGGRIGYRSPQGPVPELPDVNEVIDAEPAENVEMPSDGFAAVVFSGIDPRFDQHGFHVLKTAAEGEGLLLGMSSLSRISRNSRKLLRVLEFLFAHRARILTTNYLLTDKEVWVRRQELVAPDSKHPMKGFEVLSGLSGTHRKTVESWARQIMPEERGMQVLGKHYRN
jgi:hypothetical protein